MDESPEPKYSVLVLGRTDAGKSTLIQHIKRYANPSYEIDISFLGNGITSTTDSTQPFVVETNLPVYEVWDNISGGIINLDNLPAKYQDIDDYRDALNLRKGRDITRVSPAESVLFEFRFLDTPGFNDTRGRDHAHATNILDEMISSQQFNLILILIPNTVALTREYKEALAYYSDVLQGLHPRIALLHTKVKYEDIHHSDAAFHRNMALKNTAVHQILQRPILKSDQAAMTEGYGLYQYPCLTIDMVYNKRVRPVIECLIWKTIREILVMAKAPPLTLDTSEKNMDRIRTVVLPYKAAQEQREARARITAEAKRKNTPPAQVVDPQDSQLESPKHSVLLLGKTQAGKSTFLEFVKNYANPAYTIDESLIGTGFRSTTQMPVQFVVKTDLPDYEVFDRSGARIDISTLRDKYEDFEDYLDALNDRKTVLRTVPLDPNTPPPRDIDITFLDTPGIENTYGMDMENAPNIIREMVQMRSFNLIVIVIHCQESPSVSQQLAFDYYSQVIQLLQGHLSNVVFLYTHVDYDQMHRSNSNHISVKELKHRAFSRLFSRQGLKSHQGPFRLSKSSKEKLFPEYNINFRQRQRPVTKCMRLNTLRHILKLVVENPPSPLDTSEENLDRVWRIQHPDTLTRAQREAILTRTQAILTRARAIMEGRDDSSAPTGDSESQNVDEDDSDDYEGYFDGSPDPSSDDDYEGYFHGCPDPSSDDDDVEE